MPPSPSGGAPPDRAPVRAGRLWFSFFERSIEVVTDDEHVATILGAVYARQRVACPPLDGRADITLRVRSADDARPGDAEAAHRGEGDGAAGDAGQGARIEVGGRTLRVPSADQLAHYAHLAMLNAAAAAARDAVVLHAGAVAREGRAALLLGRSGSGKSTLTVELVRRGLGFLTDDFAVVGTDGITRPFPRRVNLTDASMALLGISPHGDDLRLPGFGGEAKTMIDAEDLVPGCLAGPAPATVLVLLDPPPAAGPRDGPRGGGTWRIAFDRVPAPLLSALAALPSVTAVRRTGADGRLVEVDAAPGGHLVRAIDALCSRLDVTVLSARRAPRGVATSSADAPRRAGPPVVTPIDVEAARTAALGHALSLSGARFFGRRSEADLLEAIAATRAALSRVEIAARIEPGDLAATADAVEVLL